MSWGRVAAEEGASQEAGGRGQPPSPAPLLPKAALNHSLMESVPVEFLPAQNLVCPL